MEEQKALVSLLLDNRVCVFRPQQNSVTTYNNVVILEPGQKFNASDREHGWYLVPESAAQEVMNDFKQILTEAELEEFNHLMKELEREYK